ncbi:4-alpha-glucanotransferase, partial [Trifolium medium]|nr:4-alpha-glucanotransferase [Trifolium medium]
ISTSSSADAVSEKQQFAIAGISEKISHPSESNGVPSKGPLAVH